MDVKDEGESTMPSNYIDSDEFYSQLRHRTIDGGRNWTPLSFHVGKPLLSMFVQMRIILFVMKRETHELRIVIHIIPISSLALRSISVHSTDSM